MLAQLACIFIGGGLGSICRYTIGAHLLTKADGAFPWSTFLANSLGCLLIGLLIGYFERRPSSLMQLLLITGFCGGFTTFSTFSNETIELFKQGSLLLAATYALLSITTGLLLTGIGAWCVIKLS